MSTTNVQNLANMTTIRRDVTDITKKLPWSLVFATIPFIPDILETVRAFPDQMARNGYALHVKHGQTEILFNRADFVDDGIMGGETDEQDK